MSKENEPKGQESAFPQNVDNSYAMNGDCLKVGPLYGGLTKREYFAAVAMQGLLAMGPDGYDDRADICAIVSVRHADALIAELEKKHV